MAVVIRLQGLRTTAGSEDIRNFFTGLKIPDGGVHIIGGEFEEAFVIFAADEHARRAMTRSGGSIKGSPVTLLLSSKAEMQNVLEENARKAEMSKNRVYNEGVRRAETVFSENLTGEMRRMDHLEMDGISGPAVREETHASHTRKALASGNDGFYLHLQGLPFSISREDVGVFFQGLQVEDVILMKNRHGKNNGMGIVKFATLHDAHEGLMRDREYIGNRFIEINSCSEKQWVEAGGSVGPYMSSPPEFPRESPPSSMEKRYPRQRTRSISPNRYRSRSSSPSGNEYCILMENLSYSVEKRGIKHFFQPVELKDDQILHLHDKAGKRTRAAFVLFRSLKDYCAGLARHKEIFASRTVYVSPISKEKMLAMLEPTQQKMEKSHERPRTSQDKSQRSQRPKYESERICIYVRNLPFDVRKVEIVDFFQGFRIAEEMVQLLRDDKGTGLGEALVTFQSEDEALRAVSLNGERFLGSEVMLKCISRMQMQEFGVMERPRESVEFPLRMRSPEGYSARHREEPDVPLHDEYPDFGIPSDVHMPLSNVHVHSRRGSGRFGSRRDGYDTFVDQEDESVQSGPGNQFDGPACVKLLNLPLNITIDEIYDFCHGYRVIQGSVALLYKKNGAFKGCATVVFASRLEAQSAIQELSGRPIDALRITLVFL